MTEPGRARVAVGQPATVDGDLASCVAAVTALLEHAASAAVDLLVLPELCLGGYNLAGIATHPERYVVTPDGQELRTLRTAVDDTGVAAVLGAAVCRQPGELVNAAVALDRGRRPAFYAKRHLWGDERAVFTAGETVVSTTLAGLRVGMAVCYDAGFPEHMRALALANVDLIACPGAFAVGEQHRRFRLYMPMRALENTVWVAAANAVGWQGGVEMAGGSLVCDPRGHVRATANEGRLLAHAEATLTDLNAARVELPYLRDRRRMQSF